MTEDKKSLKTPIREALANQQALDAKAKETAQKPTESQHEINIRALFASDLGKEVLKKMMEVLQTASVAHLGGTTQGGSVIASDPYITYYKEGQLDYIRYIYNIVNREATL